MMADGLHVHRYFLHLYGCRERELERRRADALIRWPTLMLPTAGEMAAFPGEGLATLALFATDPSDIMCWIAPPADMLQPYGLGSGSFRLLKGPPTQGGWRPFEVKDLRSPVDTRIRRCIELIEAAGLDSYVTLAFDSAVLTRGDAQREQPDCLLQVATGLTVLDEAASSVGMADQLVTQSAKEWLRMFLVWNGDRKFDESVIWPTPSGTDLVAAHVSSAAILGICLGHRLASRLLNIDSMELTSEEREELVDLFESAKHMIQRACPVAYELAHYFDDIMISDFLITLLPGPRQYERYLRGGGAGQSE